MTSARIALFWVGLIMAAPGRAAAAMVPQAPRCEYLVNPLGIDAPRPRLSWEVASGRRGERQTAYQIRVAGSAAALRAGRGDRWDSGKVRSSATAHVPYAGRPLNSGQECWWSVRCWDRDGRPSAFSVPARWTMGLLHSGDWKARWISLPTPIAAAALEPKRGSSDLEGLRWVWSSEANSTENAPADVRYFRRPLELPADRKIRAARFVLSADDQFSLSVNPSLELDQAGMSPAKQRL